jgi:hypothetical protein
MFVSKLLFLICGSEINQNQNQILLLLVSTFYYQNFTSQSFLKKNCMENNIISDKQAAYLKGD